MTSYFNQHVRLGPRQCSNLTRQVRCGARPYCYSGEYTLVGAELLGTSSCWQHTALLASQALGIHQQRCNFGSKYDRSVAALLMTGPNCCGSSEMARVLLGYMYMAK